MTPHIKPVGHVSRWAALLIGAINKPGLVKQAYRAFPDYSLGNQMLALFQCQWRRLEPGPINTYPGWQALGRTVKRGERGLTLCTTITRTVPAKGSLPSEIDYDDLVVMSYRHRPLWFVLSQTVGAEYIPKYVPEWSAEQALAALEIETIPFRGKDTNGQGHACPRRIAPDPGTPLPDRKLIHELAHVVLGHITEPDFPSIEQTPKRLREVEAEGVAFLCCEVLDLEGAARSRGFITNWLYRNPNAVAYNGQGMPERSAQKIFHAADLILRAGRLIANENANEKRPN